MSMNMIQARKKLLAGILFLALITGVVIAVFVSQKRQELRQRANLEDQPSIYFAQNNPVSVSSLSSSPTPQSIFVYLNTLSNNTTGFDVTIAAENGAVIDNATEGSDAGKFNTSLFNTVSPDHKSVRLAKFNANRETVITGRLHIATLTLSVSSEGSLTIPSVIVTKACSSPPCLDKTLSLQIQPLSFVNPSPSPQPTNPPPTLIPTSPEPSATTVPTTNPNSISISLSASTNNFIGIPVETSITPQKLLNQTQGKCYSVIGFNAQIGQARAYFSDPAKAVLNSLTELSGGKAFTLQCTEPATVVINGTSQTTLTQVAERITASNVNYLAIPQGFSTAESFLNALNQQVTSRNLHCGRIGRYSNEQNIEYYNPSNDPPSTTSVNFPLEPLKGYIASCK